MNDTEIKQCPFVDPITWHPSFTNQAAHVSSIVVVTFQVLTTPLVIFLNAVTLIIVAKFEALQKERFVVLALVAVTDVLSGLIVQPLFIAKELTHFFSKDVNCNVDTAFYLSDITLTSASLFQLACLTCERYVAITDPYKYPNRITVRKLICAAIVNWVINISLLVVYMTGISLRFIAILLILLFVLFVLIIYWYIKIFRIIHKHTIEEHKQQQNINQESHLRKFIMNKKAAITGALILGAFLLCYLPVSIGTILMFYFGPSIRGPAFFIYQPWSHWLLHLNSLFSPLIYGLRTSEFRRHFFRLFRIQNQHNDALNVPGQPDSHVLPKQSNNKNGQSRLNKNITAEDVEPSPTLQSSTYPGQSVIQVLPQQPNNEHVVSN